MCGGMIKRTPDDKHRREEELTRFGSMNFGWSLIFITIQILKTEVWNWNTRKVLIKVPDSCGNFHLMHPRANFA